MYCQNEISRDESLALHEVLAPEYMQMPTNGGNYFNRGMMNDMNGMTNMTGTVSMNGKALTTADVLAPDFKPVNLQPTNLNTATTKANGVNYLDTQQGTTPVDNTPMTENEELQRITPTTEPPAMTLSSIQYLNGALRSQIGNRVLVQFLIGTNTYQDRAGILLAVGADYIIINETDTDDILFCDFYTIKFVKVFK